MKVHMEISNLLFLFANLFVRIQAASYSSDFLDDHKPEYGKCQYKKLIYSNALENAVNNCAEGRKISENSKDGEDVRIGAACEAKCVWFTMEFLDDDDNMDLKKFNKAVEEEFQGNNEYTMLKLMSKTKDCQKELNRPDIKDDNKCEAFRPFFQCVYEAREKICKEKVVEKSDTESEEKKSLKKEREENEENEKEKSKKKKKQKNKDDDESNEKNGGKKQPYWKGIYHKAKSGNILSLKLFK